MKCQSAENTAVVVPARSVADLDVQFVPPAGLLSAPTSSSVPALCIPPTSTSQPAVPLVPPSTRPPTAGFSTRGRDPTSRIIREPSSSLSTCSQITPSSKISSTSTRSTESRSKSRRTRRSRRHKRDYPELRTSQSDVSSTVSSIMTTLTHLQPVLRELTHFVNLLRTRLETSSPADQLPGTSVPTSQWQHTHLVSPLPMQTPSQCTSIPSTLPYSTMGTSSWRSYSNRMRPKTYSYGSKWKPRYT